MYKINLSYQLGFLREFGVSASVRSNFYLVFVELIFVMKTTYKEAFLKNFLAILSLN